jgi:hypothetical protein
MSFPVRLIIGVIGEKHTKVIGHLALSAAISMPCYGNLLISFADDVREKYCL